MKKRKKLGDFDWVEIVKKNLKHPDRLAKYVSALRGTDFVSYQADFWLWGNFLPYLKDITTSLIRGIKYPSGFTWTGADYCLPHLQEILWFFKNVSSTYFSHLSHFVYHISEALEVLAITLKDNRYKQLAYALTRSYKDIKKSVIEYLTLLIKFVEEERRNDG